MDQVITDAVRTFRREFMLAIEEAEIEARELLIEDSLAQLEAGVAALAEAILG
jgi:glutamine synthetase